ncbi:phage tail tape measure protein [Rouxiella badensis]|uniref:Phage tail tape measure protein n=1 Tax=Rouxiella silvae TaxID=1646373 RepID=A0AA41BX84_9GAMM|nr:MULTISPECIES: phage tail tape measure protein [Rouxiella]MBF6637906.1 phage tail tape measure protein [Rouxiella silvae]MCC3735452.1 phage tail tape measure protein [Rouxiella badensis]MCC3760749.1 phage tail tape measure protein [Rouxiella badensis]
MATLRELIIKISANSSSFQSEISRASRMGADYYKTMENGGRKAAAATRESQKTLSELNAQLGTVKSSALGMAGAFAGVFATSQLIHFADTWNQLSGRLKLASTSTDDFNTAQSTLMSISQRTGTSLEANSSLYSRIAASLRDAGFASSDVAKVTETVATSLKLSGASTEEASSVITQLSQALGSGVLRGEEFNSIMENGGRLAKFLADGLGTTIGGLRNMANNGQLTTDKIVPLLTRVEQLRKEFETMPASISGSSQKVENAFMAWVGGANKATGASAALAGTLDGLANNIDTVANVTGTLVAIGVVRYFGNMASSIGSATGQLIAAQRSEVALAAAQVRGTQVSTARARAAVYRAQQAKVAAVGADQQAAAEKRLAAAQAQVTRNIAAREAAQTRLNSISSVGSRLGSGLLGAVGGVPGVVLGIGAAWLYTHQKNEEARKEAQEYANTIEDIRSKTSAMSLPQANDNVNKTQSAYDEQNRLVEQQAEKVRKLADEVKGYQQILTSPGPTVGGFMINHLLSVSDATKSLGDATTSLAVEQERLSQMQAKSLEIQSVLEGLEHRRVALIRQQAAEQNSAYQSLLMMNGQHTEFNRLLSLGNVLLEARTGLVSAPMRLPQAPVSSKDAQTLQQKQQQAELASLTGLAKVRKQAQFDLEKMGKTGAENATYSLQYTQALESEYNNTQKVSEAKKGATDATNAHNKAEREAASLAEQYSRKMADLSVAIEVQRVRTTEGEKASELYAASHQAGTKWTEEQRKAIRASATELETWTQKADANVKKQREQAEALKDLGEAARKYRDEATLTTQTAGLSDRQRQRFDDQQQVERVYDKTDKGAAATAARGRALDDLDKKYKAVAASEADWRSGLDKGFNNWLDNISNISGTVSQGVESTLDGAFSNMTAMLTGSTADWKSWGLSVLSMLAKVELQMAVVNLAGGSSSSTSSLFGTLASGVASYFGGSAASTSSTSTGFSTGSYNNLSFNAQGGVYDSPSLSAYSGGVYNSPTMFAFAKGAGVFGEAGPEAIMPLTRSADGSLGVRAIGGSSQGTGGGSAPQVFITIDGNGNTKTETSNGWEQFGKDIGNFVDQRYRALRDKDLGQNGVFTQAIRGNRG